MIIRLSLGSRSEDSATFLDFKLRNTPFAKIWIEQLRRRIVDGSEVKDKGRFVGLSSGNSSSDFFCGQIFMALKIINKFSPIEIDPSLLLNINQEKLNILHDKFDSMCGPDGIGTKRSNEVQVALECMNESIHSLENIISGKQYGLTPIPYIYVEYLNTPKINLPDFAYEEFSLERSFGDLFIHYSQVGKSILDAYEDEDEIMKESNIRPLSVYDGSFDIRLRGWSLKKADSLRNELSTWMACKGVDSKDKKWAVGWLVVAELIRNGETEEELISRLSNMTEVVSVELLDRIN